MRGIQWGILVTAEFNVILGIALAQGTFGYTSSLTAFLESLLGVSCFIVAIGLIQRRASARFACLYRTVVFVVIGLIQHNLVVVVLAFSTFIFLIMRPARSVFVHHADYVPSCDRNTD